MTGTVCFDEVTLRYGARTAVDRLSLVVPSGALYGLIGPNGAGKSTCLNMVTTLLPPTEGRVTIAGHDVVAEADRVRSLVGFAPEEPLVYSGLTPLEFAELSGALHGLATATATAAATATLDALGLGERADEPIATFSKGMRRKALLAAAMVHDPDLLVLDEPLEGLDVIAQTRLKELLRERTARGKTVIYSTHILEVVSGLCTHVGVLSEGRLLASGTVEEAMAQLGVSRLEEAFHDPAGGEKSP